MKQTFPPLLLVSLALTPFAQAEEFSRILVDSSSVEFVYKQMGAPVAGRLKKFAAQFSFDPDKPASAKAVFDMNMASIDAGNQEANDEISKQAWFDTQAFPQAHFISTQIKALGGNRYQVSGKMTIKGRTKEIAADFTYSRQNNAGVFDGGFTLNRSDFAIGDGAWADFDVVANEVVIRFHLLADAG
ncbi:MAG: YceI family protein [Methylomonas sp.]|jgi:polyisoprenoid-binding protein YceI